MTTRYRIGFWFGFGYVYHPRMRRLSIIGLMHLLVTYLVWGSTYLAIRVAVRAGAGWGPFWLGASRTMLAGVILLAIVVGLRARWRPSLPDLPVIIISGVLLWLGGNGGVNWAEQRVDSGLVALVIGATPMWVALIEAVIDRRWPSLLLCASLVTGFAGLMVLTAPMLELGVRADLLGIIVVVCGSICWGGGSILISRRPVATDPMATSGWQQLSGGLAFVVMALMFAEPAPSPTPHAWIAWAYLVVFGSLIAYTSYIHALKLLPTSVVMTNNYVNPVIAVVLGRLILDEPITGTTILGMVLILAGVVGVFRDRSPAEAPA